MSRFSNYAPLTIGQVLFQVRFYISKMPMFGFVARKTNQSWWRVARFYIGYTFNHVRPLRAR